MSPFASKMEQIKRVLKVPEGSWELQYNFTAKEDVDLAIERSEIERCSIECAGLDDSQCGSDSDSEFPPDKDKELRGRSDSPSRGNSSSSSDDSGSDTEIIGHARYSHARLGNHDPVKLCTGCELTEYEAVHQFYKNEEAATDFFTKHGISKNFIC